MLTTLLMSSKSRTELQIAESRESRSKFCAPQPARNTRRQRIDLPIPSVSTQSESKEKIRHLKVARYQFDSIKWNLYRERVENINDDYADFKRIQKKIFWWL